MNVFYFSSDLFISVLATSVVSLMENNKSFDEINIYIGDDGIAEVNKSKLGQLVSSYKRNVYFISLPDPSELFDFPFKERYQIGHSYPRMAIDMLLPKEVDRVLCLDSDTLVLGNLTELWSLDLGKNIMAGVADCMNLVAYKKQFKLSNDEFYCNAGVFLINLNAWRENRIGEDIKKCIKDNNGNIFFFEQTLMNYVCKGNIFQLHPKYNSYTLLYAFKFENLVKWRKPTFFYSEKEVSEAKENPKIIHFTRNFYMMSRPWIEGCDHPLTEIYQEYKKLTPWKVIEKDTRNKIKKWKYKLWHLLPKRLLVICASFLYNVIRPRIWWKNE